MMRYFVSVQPKIIGGLRRLRISWICRQTVKNIIKEEGDEQSPKAK